MKLESTISDFRSAALEFERLPFRDQPYSGRNWGNPLHSLCSYQGKLKPAIAHFLIKGFTVPGNTVLDPLSGAGTIPLEAMLSGRRAFANDIQELGFILSSAKVSAPDFGELESEFLAFVESVRAEKGSLTQSDMDLANFGMNGTISEYFHPENLSEVIAARKYVASLPMKTSAQAIVAASFLHILHGNRPYALSRTSHPVTPFKPSGEFVYRDFEARLRAKIDRAAGSYPLLPSHSSMGRATLGSFEHLEFDGEVDAVITSPPFASSTRFYVSNWMRLWAAGWTKQDFQDRKKDFIEEKQKKDYGIYGEFFLSASRWLKPGGKLILHLGKTEKVDMAEELTPFIPESFSVIHKFNENVNDSEKFGIRDQGATSTHQFMFLLKLA
jgi:hypothetical protein